MTQQRMRQFRHGDVFLEEVGAVPLGATEVRRGDVVLAEGEVTGHRHAIDARGATVIEWDATGQRYVTIEGGRPLTQYRLTGDLPNHYRVDEGHTRRPDDAVEHQHLTGVVLDHEEHGKEAIPAGNYAFGRLNVYEDEEVRSVAD